MTDDSPVDLAKLDAWCGVRPGMTRAQVQEEMKRRGVDLEDYGSADSLTATTDDWELGLDFTTDGMDRVRQMTIEGDAVQWNGQPLIGLRMDDAFHLLGSPASVDRAPPPTGDPSAMRPSR